MDDDAHRIQEALKVVAGLREGRQGNAALDSAYREVKRFQARRFTATYNDLLSDPRYAGASGFFLQELYGDKDYAERDQQFSRIAATIARLFPKAVVDTAATLAEVHAMTEQLDDAMASEWLGYTEPRVAPDNCARYVQCWRNTADQSVRQRQLERVLELGNALERLTRLPGLRTLLKMMRRPAAAAGLSALQRFLENGFDAFADMRGAGAFLGLIQQRESHWIQVLFDSEAVACETLLRQLLDSSSSH